MILRYLNLIQRPTLFSKVTGLQRIEFDDLLCAVLPTLATAEDQRLQRPQRRRAPGGGRAAELALYDQVLLTVVWLRLYPTHEVLGMLFGVSDSTVCRVIQRVLPVLEQAGQDTFRLPDPGRQQRRTLPALLADTPELAVIVDSFEQPVQRPRDLTERDTWYSHKKRRHTVKSQIGVQATGYISTISASVKGRTHDLTLLKESGLLTQLPEGVGILGDLGYQGLRDLHPKGACPRKKPWGKDKPRPPEDVLYNQAFSQRRIVVANTINRLRRYQSLTQVDRQHRQHHTARVRAVAGLVNRQLLFRQLL